jgi:hypothetical protein
MKTVIMITKQDIKQYFKAHFKHSMKTYYYSFFLLISSYSAIAQENKPFTIGFEKSFVSKILNQERKVWIHIPNSNGGNTGNEPYPVIYLLDGDENFNDIVSITEFMSKTGLCPPMIVVGILASRPA